jgi:hypothetical protein
MFPKLLPDVEPLSLEVDMAVGVEVVYAFDVTGAQLVVTAKA